ncbi:CPBP family intramembrane glutamic endopeptidase [Litchfieldia alkalitelluris]|uniref:CPBP family intramembrane glutamic endopeptidase n=1 Tax=Litchfieldia alkalitelluris TaxID=304268 RepID=UPI00195A3C7D|nr:type II CAAX endopeptidase family protein [Litchfieldia alkalitelluris]
MIIIIIAHTLLFISFLNLHSFWIVFVFSYSVLTYIGIKFGDLRYQGNFSNIILLGVLSGIALYFLFFLGKNLTSMLSSELLAELNSLYKYVQPTATWHYLFLFFLIIPGEEIFWRGFIQTSLLKLLKRKHEAIVISAGFYATANLFSGSIMFIFATFISGLLWGYLYQLKQNIILNVLSHTIFNVLLLILFPLF